MAIKKLISCVLAILGILIVNVCILAIVISEKNEILLLCTAIVLIIVDIPLLRAIRGKAVWKSG